jgi:ribosomal protein S27E
MIHEKDMFYKPVYIITCSNCSTKNKRRYLPEKIRCSVCGKMTVARI